MFNTLFTIPTEEQIEKYAHPPVPNRPALDLAAYTGTYRNEFVGKVEITAENGILYLTRGLHQAPLPLRHWDGIGTAIPFFLILVPWQKTRQFLFP